MSQEKLRRFEEQVSPHLKAAYNLAEWLTRSHEDAEDIVQEAFPGRRSQPSKAFATRMPSLGPPTIVRRTLRRC